MENVETYFMPCSILKSALFSLSSACLFVCLFVFFFVFVVVVFCFVLIRVISFYVFFVLFCFVFYVHSYHCVINITRNTPWFVFDFCQL